MTIPLTVSGETVGVALVVLDPRGDFTALQLGELGPGRHVRSVSVPSAARGGRLVALRLAFPVIAAFVAGHRESGTALSVADASRGVLRLGRVRAGGVELPSFAGWTGTGGVRAEGSTIHYLVNRAADSFLRPREPLEGIPVPVVASPAVARAAGPDGTLPLHVAQQTIEARVVGVARYFPSTDGDFVAADLATWFAATNAADPGTVTSNELWLDAPQSAAGRLARAPFDVLQLASQRETAAGLRADPLARGALALLLAIAVAGLVLAAVGVLLVVVGDVRDASGELFDLQAQGAAPAELRRHVFLRAAVVAVIGLAAGVAAGAVVSTLVVAVVTVTAGAGNALPPLSLVYDWPIAAAALAAVAAGSIAGAAAATRNAYDRVARVRFSEGIE